MPGGCPLVCLPSVYLPFTFRLPSIEGSISSSSLQGKLTGQVMCDEEEAFVVFLATEQVLKHQHSAAELSVCELSRFLLCCFSFTGILGKFTCIQRLTKWTPFQQSMLETTECIGVLPFLYTGYY